MKNKRESKFELLRIIAMLMIVANHLFRHGIIHANTTEQYKIWLNANKDYKIISTLFLPGGRVGVAIFFMLTGFFSIKRETPVSIKKITLICIDYGIILGLLMLFFNVLEANSFKISTIVASVFLPLTQGLGWFIPVYIIIVLLSNYFNNIFNNLNNKGKILFILIIWYTEYSLGSLMHTTYYGIARGLLFYLIGAFLQTYINETKKNILYVIIFIFSWVGIAVLELKIGMNVAHQSFINSSIFDLIITSVLVPSCAISLFMIVMYTDINYNSTVNYIASSTFSVYLIHDSLLGHMFFWEKMFIVEKIWMSNLNPLIFIIYVLVSTLLVLIICVFLDKLRLHLKSYCKKTIIYKLIYNTIYERIIN